MLHEYLNPDMYPHLYRYRRTVPSHDGGVLADCDWGGPCDWTAVCSCGWASHTYTNYYSYGGTISDALHDLLHHQHYNPDTEHTNITQRYTAALTTITELATTPVDEGTLKDTLTQIAATAETLNEAFNEYEEFTEAYHRPPYKNSKK